ncbi:hypothetical protein BV25DRAFT_1348117 [Artomyces pyxidatus]|uniref:Uncharacterized protein n=1 Tax=Artomyces pyxidatus TaxID=48021 RepID=A0ACB8SPH4_9AGAM|nr:hypothetical protein BV25DRAFT_1348117 [Artomyces pyxidatus]
MSCSAYHLRFRLVRVDMQGARKTPCVISLLYASLDFASRPSPVSLVVVLELVCLPVITAERFLLRNLCPAAINLVSLLLHLFPSSPPHVYLISVTCIPFASAASLPGCICFLHELTPSISQRTYGLFNDQFDTNFPFRCVECAALRRCVHGPGGLEVWRSTWQRPLLSRRRTVIRTVHAGREPRGAQEYLGAPPAALLRGMQLGSEGGRTHARRRRQMHLGIALHTTAALHIHT